MLTSLPVHDLDIACKYKKLKRLLMDCYKYHSKEVMILVRADYYFDTVSGI